MNMEWCVCDLDGTLLNSHSRLSQETIDAVGELRQVGVGVVLATGRPDLFVKDIAYKLGVTKPIISCNGGMVRNIWTGEVLFNKTIDQAAATNIVEYCLDNRYDLLAYTPDQIYFSNGSERVNVFHRYNHQVQEEFRVPLTEISAVSDLPLSQVIKFLVSNVDAGAVVEFEQVQNQCGCLSMVPSMRGVLDIMADGISKGEALRFLGQKLGMDMAKTVVFGDNYNDISMLRLAGCPIVVANAEEEVKKVAKYITLSNDEAGVAYAIRKYILQQEGKDCV